MSAEQRSMIGRIAAQNHLLHDAAIRAQARSHGTGAKTKRARGAQYLIGEQLLRLDGDECEAEPAKTVRKYGKRVLTKQSLNRRATFAFCGDDRKAQPTKTVRKYGESVATQRARRKTQKKVVSRSPGTAYTTMAASFRT
jgi:hypothetical protein